MSCVELALLAEVSRLLSRRQCYPKYLILRGEQCTLLLTTLEQRMPAKDAWHDGNSEDTIGAWLMNVYQATSSRLLLTLPWCNCGNGSYGLMLLYRRMPDWDYVSRRSTSKHLVARRAPQQPR